MIKFKTDLCKERFSKINTTLQTMCVDMADFCDKRGKEFVLVETMTTGAEDKALGRVSVSHAEGRAVDCRTRDWSKEFLDLFLVTFNAKYGSLGAISKGDGQRKLLVYHDAGFGPHIHVQLDSKYSMPRIQS